jgi:hypothetical protein
MLFSRLSSRRVSRINATPGNPTFSRPSAANDPYTGASVASGAPRFPGIAGSVGVMVEEGTTNLVLWSQDFINGFWIKSGTTLTTGLAAPDGTPTATGFSFASGSNFIYQNVNVTAGTTYTFSFFAKNNGGTGSFHAVYNNTGAAFITGPTDFSAQINAAAWSRVSVTFTAPAGCTQVRVYLTANSAATANFIVWGAQLEAKAYLTAHIPTTSATATRSPETLTIPTANVLNPSQGTIIVRAYVDGDILKTNPSAAHYIFYYGGNPWNRVIARFDTGGTILAGTVNGSGTATVVNAPLPLSRGWHTIGLRWSVSGVAIFVDGVKKDSKPSGTPPDVAGSTLYRGCDDAGTTQLGQPIDALRISSVAISDAEMAQATAGILANVRGQTYALDFDSTLQQYGRPLTLPDRFALGLL